MNITFITNDITGIGGSKKVTTLLANEMSKYHNVKILSIFQSEDSIDYTLSDKISITYLYKKKMKIYELSTYKKFIKERKYNYVLQLIYYLLYICLGFFSKLIIVRQKTENDDIIIIPEIYGVFFTLLKVRKIKQIVHLHHTYEYIMNNKFNYITLLLNKKRISKFVVLTENDKKLFLESGFCNVVKIYNPCKGNAKLRNYISKRVVFIGRLDYIKGVDYLLNIIDELRLDTEIIFEIYGDGPLRTIIEDYIVVNNINNVHLIGFVNNIPDVLQNVNCLLNTSRFEGLPMVFIEAFQAGIPIVASKSFPSINDIVINEYNGYIFENSNIQDACDKIRKLVKDEILNEQIGVGSFNSFEQFKIDNIIVEWEDIFNKIKKDGLNGRN